MPIDINLLRVDKGGDPEIVRNSEILRGRDGKIVDEILDADKQWREALFAWERLKTKLNAVSKAIGEKKQANRADPCEAEQAEAVNIKADIANQDVVLKELSASRDALLHKVGNLVRDDVPISNDEVDNKVVRSWGKISPIVCDGETPGRLLHHQILHRLKGFETAKGSLVAGHKGYYLKGYGYQLASALVQYGMNFLSSKGYCPVQPPFFMRQEMMEKTAELKDFEESLYCIGGKSEDKKDDMYLIATSEQPLCALHADDILSEERLPIRYAGMSTCFRKEAGSSGKDVWGIFRVHQFEKVEQFVITTPEESDAEQERMIAVAEEFYQSLGLAYQVINIVSGALNDAAARKYDLEAWFPGYNTYRELVSCSNCTDYQSRALDIKLGHKKQGDRERRMVHMLNGTLCASQRTLCCILENYQTDAGVRVPAPLVPYMGGLEFLPFPEETAEEKKLNLEKRQKEKNFQAKQAEAMAKKQTPQ